MIKYCKGFLILMLWFLTCPPGAAGQDAVPAAGGDASGSGGSVSFSFGQLIYNTYVGSSGSVVEGMQQPFEISLITGMEGIQISGLSLSLYPNPANDLLTAELKHARGAGQLITLEVFDAYGKRMHVFTLVEGLTTLTISDLTPGLYFIRAFDGIQSIQTYKLIKQ